MALRLRPTRLHSAASVIPVAAVCVVLTIAAAFTVRTRADAAGERAFDQQSDIVGGSIEGQIERHIDAVEDTAAFADATWPGDIHAWRAYITDRINTDAYLAFSSSPGLIEVVPADQVAAFEARESASSGQPFAVTVGETEPGADLLVLSRTAIDTKLSGIPIRGLDTGPTIDALGLEVPDTDDPLVMLSLEDAPAIVDEVLGITAKDIDDVPIIGTNVVFVRALGPAGTAPLGWVVAPAHLGNLSNAASSSTGDLNVTVAVPDLEIDGDLGRFEGVDGLAIEDARHAIHRDYEAGGLTWAIDIWADADYGAGSATTGPYEVILAGLFITVVLCALLYGRRRHQLRLGRAEFELSLQRTMSETDSLTGLLNRAGLHAHYAEVSSDAGATVLFLDLDQFKSINDGSGHAAGDRTLVAVAHAIRSVARDGDLMARLGGDEFIVVCPGVGDADAAHVIAHRLEEAVRRVDAPEPLSASIGVAVARPASGHPLETLVDIADKSMYEAKHSGGARTVMSNQLEPVDSL